MSNSLHKPVGGVLRVLLHAADTLEGVEFMPSGCRAYFSDSGVEVLLKDDCSTYVEERRVLDGRIAVEHRLHLVARRNEADEWLDEAFAQGAVREGLMAEVWLNDGRALLVGYSQYMTSEQPLRLDTLSSTSGATLREEPLVTLDLKSTDTSISTPLSNI